MSISSLLKRIGIKQFIRFCIVGLECATLTYLIFVICFYFFSINYLIAATLGIIAGVSFGFSFNRLFTFQSKKRVAITAPKYFLVYGISWLFNMIALKYLVESMKIIPIIANLLLIPIIVAINFFGAKIFAFQDRRW